MSASASSRTGAIPLGPAQQPAERRSARGVEPRVEDVGRQLLPPGRRRRLAGVGARARRRRGRTAGPRTAGPGRRPGWGARSRGCRWRARSGRGARGTGRATRRRARARRPPTPRPGRRAPPRRARAWPRVHSARSQSDFSARIGVLSKPTRNVDAAGSPGPAHERVVEAGEEHLAGRGERDDRLDGRVVPGARVEQLLHAVEELPRR